MVAILLKAAARELRHDVCDITRTPSLLMRRLHNGQYAGCACRIEKGVVAVGALAPETSST